MKALLLWTFFLIVQSCYGQPFSDEVIIDQTGPVRVENLHIADLDNDGLQDILIGGAGQNNVYWRKNLGNFRFDEAKHFQTSGNAASAVMAKDIDGDGMPDVVSLCYQEEYMFGPITEYFLYWFKNLGEGNFGSGNIISIDYSEFKKQLIIEDLNNDNALDIISSDGYNINLGNNVFGEYTFLTDNARIEAAADINGDGVIDLLRKEGYNAISVNYGLGNGNFSQSQILYQGIVQFLDMFIVEDINNDNFKDIIAFENGIVKSLINNGAGIFDSIGEAILNNTIKVVQCSDFNNDGYNDLVYGADYDSLYFYLNTGNGAFGQSVTLSIPEGLPVLTCIFAADLNGDELIDLVASEGSYSVSRIDIFESFISQGIVSRHTLERKAAIVSVADIDGNGFKDLITADCNCNGIGGILGIFHNNGAFDFGMYDQCSPPLENDFRGSFIYRDVNSDGQSDCVQIFQTNDIVSLKLFHNNANEEFVLVSISNFPINITSLEGWDSGVSMISSSQSEEEFDIITRFESDLGDVLLHFYHYSPLEGFTKIHEAIFPIESYMSKHTNTKDFDGDGDGDLVYRSGNGRLMIFENLGQLGYVLRFTYYEPPGSSISPASTFALISEDFNADGLIDIAINDIPDRINLFINQGNYQFSAPTILDSLTFFIHDLMYFDINEDGLGDIVFSALDSTYSIGYFINNGNGTFSNRQLLKTKRWGYSSIDTADLDNDGDRDLIATNWETQKIVVFENRRYVLKTLEDSRKDLTVQISPNPTNNIIEVKANFKGDLPEFSLFSYTGKCVLKGILPSNGLLDIRELQSGLYFLVLTYKSGTIANKIIKI